MHVIRPIQRSDLQPFLAMANSASLGMSNLPKNEQLLSRRIERCLAKEEYLFVLENQENGSVEGVSGILKQSELEYYYEIQSSNAMLILTPLIVQNGPSEICTLFLAHFARSHGLGRLLSLSRFLFIAAFPHLFTETITALMRGYFDEQAHSPFWDSVGRKFLDLDIIALIKLREEGQEFVQNIVPKYPLYVALLPKEAQEAVGAVHAHTLPALKMLQEEGFSPTGKVDFFDAGPQIAAKRDSIRTVRTSRLATIAEIGPVEGPLKLIGNERLDFRAVHMPMDVIGNAATISPETASLLQVQKGDPIRYV